MLKMLTGLAFWMFAFTFFIAAKVPCEMLQISGVLGFCFGGVAIGWAYGEIGK